MIDLLVRIQVGIEAEFLPLKDGKPIDCRTVRDTGPQPCYRHPSFDVLPHDDFVALAEVRANPAESVKTCYGNFAVEFAMLQRICREQGLSPFFGEFEWDDAEYQKIIKLMDKKDKPSQWRNVYNHPLRPVRSKKAKFVRGGGLHIHFSAHVCHGSYKYSLLSFPVIETIVKTFDSTYNGAIQACQGAYRVPGMWEPKPWGFEYRSLPFNQWAIDSMLDIVDFSFVVLNQALVVP